MQHANQSEEFEKAEKHAHELALLSNNYCNFIDNIENNTADQIFQYLHVLLPMLYFKGILLPKCDYSEDEAPERFVTEEQWHLKYLSIKKKVATLDSFLFLPNLVNENQEPQLLSLTELLTDVYQDCKDYVMLFYKNTLASQNNAIALMHENFSKYWGYKLSIVIPYLHTIIHKEQITQALFEGNVTSDDETEE